MGIVWDYLGLYRDYMGILEILGGSYGKPSICHIGTACFPLFQGLVEGKIYRRLAGFCDQIRALVISVKLLHYSTENDTVHTWLVVPTQQKYISQLGQLFPIYGKIKTVPNHRQDNVHIPYCNIYNSSTESRDGMLMI